MVKDYSCTVREREERRKIMEKAQKKPLCSDLDLNRRTLSPEPSLLSVRPQHPVLCLLELEHKLEEVIKGHSKVI